ncbi:MAG: hypothetical protein ABI358_09945 [Ginsengibacter sp.]
MAGIPLVRVVNFPINSFKLRLGKLIEKNDDLHVKTGFDNNLSINGNGKTKLGDASSSNEQDINFSFKLKSEE